VYCYGLTDASIKFKTKALQRKEDVNHFSSTFPPKVRTTHTNKTHLLSQPYWRRITRYKCCTGVGKHLFFQCKQCRQWRGIPCNSSSTASSDHIMQFKLFERATRLTNHHIIASWINDAIAQFAHYSLFWSRISPPFLIHASSIFLFVRTHTASIFLSLRSRIQPHIVFI